MTECYHLGNGTPTTLSLKLNFVALCAAFFAFVIYYISAGSDKRGKSTRTATMSAPLVIKATAKHTATVIFVHGLGDSGAGWRPVAEMLGKDPALSHVKWVLPNA